MLVRRAQPDDLDQLTGLVDRCTAETLYRRFHGAAGPTIRRELGRIAAPSDRHRSWVAVTEDGRVRGTATLAWSRSGTTEAAFLVEDTWFRRGIGRALFELMAVEAVGSEVDAIVARVQADNRRAQRFLLAVAPHAEVAFAGGGELDVTIPVVRRDRPGCLPEPEAPRQTDVRGAA